jgi:hypothetical protein
MTTAIVDRRKRRRIIIVCLLAIGLSSISILRVACPSRPRLDYRPIKATGQFIAEETLKLTGNKGEIVVVSIESEAANVQLKAFKSALTRQPGVTILAIEKVDAAKLTVGPMGAGISPQQFFDLLKKYPKVGAIVLLLGPPLLKDQEIQSVPQGLPKIVVFSGMGLGVKKLLEEEVISLAIVPRIPGAAMQPGATPSSSPPSAESSFPYEALTPQEIQRRVIFEPPMPPQPGQKK